MSQLIKVPRAAGRRVGGRTTPPPPLFLRGGGILLFPICLGGQPPTSPPPLLYFHPIIETTPPPPPFFFSFFFKILPTALTISLRREKLFLFVFCFFVFSEHTQVTPGLPMLQLNNITFCTILSSSHNIISYRKLKVSLPIVGNFDPNSPFVRFR